jgi:hypothetical protein
VGQLGESGVSSDGKVGEYGYSRLQGCSLRLCRLRTVRSGTLNEHLICTDHMLALWDPVNQRNSMIVVVGQYPIIPLEMFSCIVYGLPTNSSVCGIACGRCALGRGGTRSTL